MTPIEIVTIDPPAAPPLDVQLFGPPASEPPAAEPPATRPAERPPRAPAAIDDARAVRPRVSSSSAPAVDAARTADAATQPGDPTHRHPLLAMRRGEAPSAALPAGRWDDLDHAPRGTTPERPRVSGLLHESGGGEHASD